MQWRDWGGDSVVFDARSGQTHQLAPLAAAVMAHLELQACSGGQILAAIAADLDADADEALRGGLQAIAQQLQRLGWVETVVGP